MTDTDITRWNAEVESGERLKHEWEAMLAKCNTQAAEIARLEAEREKLPYDIHLPNQTFGKGVKLSTFVEAAARWKQYALDYYALEVDHKTLQAQLAAKDKLLVMAREYIYESLPQVPAVNASCHYRIRPQSECEDCHGIIKGYAVVAAIDETLTALSEGKDA